MPIPRCADVHKGGFPCVRRPQESSYLRWDYDKCALQWDESLLLFLPAHTLLMCNERTVRHLPYRSNVRCHVCVCVRYNQSALTGFTSTYLDSLCFTHIIFETALKLFYLPYPCFSFPNLFQFPVWLFVFLFSPPGFFLHALLLFSKAGPTHKQSSLSSIPCVFALKFFIIISIIERSKSVKIVWG